METQNKIQYKGKVHRVLAHSYITYFVLLLIGIYLDMIYKIKIFSNPTIKPMGIIFLILATFIIIWAQKTGHEFRKVSEKRAEHFHQGPYRYSRIPTHWGLFLLIFGFGIISNSFFVVLSTIISFFISKFIFINKHDKILEIKYGVHYLEYKKLVKF